MTHYISFVEYNRQKDIILCIFMCFLCITKNIPNCGLKTNEHINLLILSTVQMLYCLCATVSGKTVTYHCIKKAAEVLNVQTKWYHSISSLHVFLSGIDSIKSVSGVSKYFPKWFP